VPDAYFHSAALDPAIYGKLARIAAIVREQPGLTVEVEGHSDDRGDPGYLERSSLDRATAIRDILVRQGVPERAAFARGFGSSRPLGPNANAPEREQNRRVEIVISGNPIGGLASWDRTYDVSRQK